jgi:linoleoyl-CoA desaturase
MYFKSAIIFAWWIGSYLAIIFAGLPLWANALLCVSFGLAGTGIGFGVMHDANHDGYSKNPRTNKILGWSVELIGFSSFIWRQQHNIWHHTYTNISGLDEALEAEGAMRWSPRDEWKPFFRFQHLYWPFIYAFAAASLLLHRNFRVYFTGRSGGVFRYPTMSTNDKIVFWCFRIVNALVLFIIPLFFFSLFEVIIGFLLSVAAVGLVLITILQLAHIMATVDFPEPTGDPLVVENEWAIHQVRTTTNFAPNNAVLNWYVGGLNYQIEHHLFPQICHLHYPKIAPIVRQVCEEYGIPYRSHPTLWAALVDHYNLLKWLGQEPVPVLDQSPVLRAAPSVSE